VIGVMARPEQGLVVAEFFELFKTPWEFHQEGRRYDVVLATASDIPSVDTRLLIVLQPGATSADSKHGLATRPHQGRAAVTYRGREVPVYGTLATVERVNGGSGTSAFVSAVVQVASSEVTVIRVGYDLFDEVRYLLETGQPVEHAQTPTLDIHISMLRDWILRAGIPLVEVLPTPAGHSHAVCLTHDIDFVGIRLHRFDHSMWGFLYRSTVGAARNLLRGRLSLSRLIETWRAVASLPFVYLGWARDFWEPFEWYLRVEKGLPATYYLIPFKRRAGERVGREDGHRRGTAYDVDDIRESIATLQAAGCELGVHGIDAWHSIEKGREEMARIADGESPGTGIRMHWLLSDARTPEVLDKAGYVYDSTTGYNETIGYRAGTTQVFRPLGAADLLELPMHIQDGAMFFPQQLDLSDEEAWQRCEPLVAHAQQTGGVLTLLWHDRSHGPERFWGGFYVRLVESLKRSDAWFATGAQVVAWFRNRRRVSFEDNGHESVVLRFDGEVIEPPLRVRLHQTATSFVDLPWDGKTHLDMSSRLAGVLTRPAEMPALELCSLA
jgi:hypothetical protein